jgi:hypothetical protein
MMPASLQQALHSASAYIPSSVGESVAAVSSYIPSELHQPINGVLAGHVVTLLLGEKVGFATSLALAYYGAKELDYETAKSLALATGLYIFPSVATQVASNLISTAIIESVGLGARSIKAIALCCCCGTDPRDEKLQGRKQKISRLKDKVAALQKEVADLKQKAELALPPIKTEPALPGSLVLTADRAL